MSKHMSVSSMGQLVSTMCQRKYWSLHCLVSILSECCTHSTYKMQLRSSELQCSFLRSGSCSQAEASDHLFLCTPKTTPLPIISAQMQSLPFIRITDSVRWLHCLSDFRT